LILDHTVTNQLLTLNRQRHDAQQMLYTLRGLLRFLAFTKALTAGTLLSDMKRAVNGEFANRKG